MHGRDIDRSERRATAEEIATGTRLHTTTKFHQRLDETKSSIERRFALLWKRKKDLSNDKQAHTAAINAVEMFLGQKDQLTAELATVNDNLEELGQQLAARNFSAGKNVSELYARSMSLSANLERNFDSTERARSEIARLAPTAAEYDQVVALIAQMDEFSTKLYAALNGVLDELTIPTDKAE